MERLMNMVRSVEQEKADRQAARARKKRGRAGNGKPVLAKDKQYMPLDEVQKECQKRAKFNAAVGELAEKIISDIEEHGMAVVSHDGSMVGRALTIVKNLYFKTSVQWKTEDTRTIFAKEGK
jgi:hypothetical protein